MCWRATYKLTWEEIVALYRLALDQPALNTRARYNERLSAPTADGRPCAAINIVRLGLNYRW
jgi:hypothetical protein